MAPVAFSRIWRSGVEEQLAAGELSFVSLKELLDYMGSDEFPRPEIAAAISQPYRQAQLSIYDAAAFNEILALLRGGYLGIASAALGGAPGKDRQGDHNNATLAKLPAGLEAEFAGGPGDNDGRFGWTVPLPVKQARDGHPQVTAWLRPGELPLEVGHTDPETTLWHLMREGGVARWPYREPSLTVLVMLGDPSPFTSLRWSRVMPLMPDAEPLSFWTPDAPEADAGAS